MVQLKGSSQPGLEHLVYKLRKSLYRLKQSLRQWYKKFNSYMIKIGYKIYEYNYCVYVKSLNDDSFIFSVTYMDDILIVVKSISDVNKLTTLLSREFNMKDLDDAKKILGMKIYRGRTTRRLWLS